MARKRFLLLAAAVAAGVSVAALSGCAAPQASDYAGEKPALDLARYFNGRVLAHGMFQDRFGKVAKRFTVTINGQWTGNQGVLDESFIYSDGSTGQRVWRLTQHAGGRVTGTADDVVGEAVGYTAGNAFHWNYTLRQPVGDKVYEVQMDDWMVLVDERVMLNRATMRKFGVRLGEVTLAFTKP
ncbi:hypothetical protein B2J86_06685 [Acidovorax sp. SRB_14]|uniref:DUF3833 domain-containing protein n=1 Tax=unclassified Acidovorax TaxID=2684926 RepID=UPI00145C7D71|nr:MULTISPECIES: DUF3833 domain-containing protein [unclassified Acidovorax]NMM76591.1 hypothetical protein [Acidovorax sp. SRB_24]NMM80618.1 hypothetical protein [Acidovorax sp. SRB_14]